MAGKKSQPARRGQKGPNVRALEKVAGQCRTFESSIRLDLDDGYVILSVGSGKYGVGSTHTLCKEKETRSEPGVGSTLGDCMLYLTNRWRQGTVRLDSVSASTEKGPLPSKEVKALALAAWCEARGVEVPSRESLKDQKKARKTEQEELREECLRELRRGRPGVKWWNARKQREREKVGHFRRADLSGANLTSADFQGLDFKQAIFDGATLAKATLFNCDFTEARLRNVNLKGARCGGVRGQSADFNGACLCGCNLRASNYRKADFRNADLEGADLSYTDLRGADLSSAKLEGSFFDRTKFDEATRLPPGFEPPDGLVWAGVGPDPRFAPGRAKKPTGPIDVDTLLKRLQSYTDPKRYRKAIAMLKADRFKLFAQVADESLVGVVKSQTDADLVYSCRLSADGSFSCCTQNLFACGGLQGRPCKHLLVLIVGLAKAGELDPTLADQWVAASRGQKPVLDREAMSETFLRYKGAEAGEIDWRPTETLPEDYYAL
jgi:hypothetical protein